MRKDARENITVNLANIQGYHEGGWHGNYAYQGFKSNKYFVSDRWEALDSSFRRKNGRPLQGYGLEIETECSKISDTQVLAEVFDKIIFAVFPEDLFKMQRDGSLDAISAECITQVMTKTFIRNKYAAFKAMYDTYFPAFGISCTRTGNCGMHVNISNAVFGASEKAQTEAIRKLLYLVNKHFNLFCVLTNRDRNHTGFCGVMSNRVNRYYRGADFTNKDNCKTADLNHMPADHSNCCNFSHFPEGRVELRIVGGQSKFGCFRNTMESIFHVVEAVKALSWNDLDNVVKLFTGCNQYVFNRLSTNCLQAGVITSEQVEAIRGTVVREELL